MPGTGFFLLLFLLSFSSCGFSQGRTPGNSSVLGVPRRQAAQLLETGDVAFIRQAQLPSDFSRAVSRLKRLSGIDPAAAFYAGLLAPDMELLLFCAALESRSIPARREAVQKLIPLVMQTEEIQDVRNVYGFLRRRGLRRRADLRVLRSACLYRLGRYDEAAGNLPAEPTEEWGRALALFSAWKAPPFSTLEASPASMVQLAQEIVDYLFALPAGEARRWAYREALSLQGLFTSRELAILNARLTPGNHWAVLDSMDDEFLFILHRELLLDLGRAYLNIPGEREAGIKYFTDCNNFLEEHGFSFGELNFLDSGEQRDRRYLIFYYLGRLERARGNHDESSRYFWQALDFAPDALQSDACIWYILMNALAQDSSSAVTAVLNTMPRWSDTSYFNGFLDRLSRDLTAARQWPHLLEIFSRLEHMDTAASLSQYAWIIGRAAEEGFLETGRSRESFFRIAFEEPRGSFYYRAMAASRLRETLVPETNAGPSRSRRDRGNEEEMAFLLGFFECGAAHLAMPYVRPREEELSIPELRRIAQAFASSQRWQESLSLAGRYFRRQDFSASREDLYLFYPRPYRELIEQYARQAELEAHLLFALIRTESFFNAGAVSRSGAVGLAQLMPATAAEMADRIFRQGGPDYRGLGALELSDPHINVRIGSFYLRRLTELLENPLLALLAYNGGIGRVRRWVSQDRALADGGLPLDLFMETIEFHETREYGRLVLGAAAAYGYLYYGMSMTEAATGVFAD